MNVHPQTTTPTPTNPDRACKPVVKTILALALLMAAAVVVYSIYISIHEPDPQETVILGQTKLAENHGLLRIRFMNGNVN